jgi:predicted RNase H-like HicB family nuclease
MVCGDLPGAWRASQGRTVKEAHAMIQEAVNLFLETASPEEIKRCLA